MELRIIDAQGLAVVRDASVEAPDVDRRSLAPLAEMARAGEIFYLDGEDPIDLRVRLLAEEDLDSEISGLYDLEGGTFLLRAPSGTLELSGFEAWRDGARERSVPARAPAATCGLQVFRLRTTDLAPLIERTKDLVGADDWRFRNRVDTAWLLGCLPTLAAILFVVVPALRPYAAWTVAAAAASWLPPIWLRSTKRYKDIVERQRAFESSLPHFILVLRPLESDAGLVGGSVVT